MVLFLCSLGCGGKQEPDAPKSDALPIDSLLFELPDTPEEVLKLYQAYYDSNHFELAMMLSTPTEQERLQNVNKLIDNSEEQDSTVFLTKFLELQCKPKGKKDTVLCECLLEDRFGPYQQPFRIVKLNNQWLVDKLEDDFMIDENPDNDIQKFLDSLENGYY